MRTRTVLWAIVLALLVVLAGCAKKREQVAARAADAAVPAMQDAVTDTAGKLSPADDRALEERITAYRKRTGNEIAVLVIGSLAGQSIEDVAYRTFNTWGIGQKGKDNGVLLVIAPNERKTRIETGKGIGHLLTDVESGRILRERVGPLLKQDRFKEAIEAALDAIEAALDERAAPAIPGASVTPNALYVLDLAGALDEAAEARLEGEAAREGRLFHGIAIYVVADDAAAAPPNSIYEELRGRRIAARADPNPMIVTIATIGGRPIRATVRPASDARFKDLDPRVRAVVTTAPSLEEAIRGVIREQSALTRHYDQLNAKRAAAEKEEKERASVWTIIGVVVLVAFVAGFIWLLVWAYGFGRKVVVDGSPSGGGSDSSSSYSSGPSYSESSSYSTTSSSSSSSSDTSYSGGGGESGGGGASDSY